MLESIFVTLVIFGFVLFILGIMDKNIVFSATSILMWIVIMAAQIYIEVPNASNTYNEPALYPIGLGLIFINIVWIIIQYFDIQFRRKGI